MKNVYGEIQKFYEENKEIDFLVGRPMLENYLRRQAWKGLDEETLLEKWYIIAGFFQYLNFIETVSLEDLTKQDCIHFFFWMEDVHETFFLSEEIVAAFLDELEEFFRHLKDKKVNADSALFPTVRAVFFPNGKFARPELPPEENILPENLESGKSVSEETANKLNFLLERLLSKIGIYYKHESFAYDFNRAISMYTGPFNIAPEQEREEFWLGFWDYFLFDYHLMDSDVTPLRYFYEHRRNTLSSDEQRILSDLLKAKFVTFYIRRIVDAYTVECVDLMTGEKIEIPMPDYGLCDYKKMLFYGHIYSEGVVMLNYITSVAVSLKLRKRIQEEILRQQALFARQQGQAEVGEFFARHAILVRHIIDILVHLAKVNVGLPLPQQEKQQLSGQCTIDENHPVYKCLHKLAKKYRLSHFAETLLLKMWLDHRAAVLSEEPMTEQAEASALFLSFSMINGMNYIQKKRLLKFSGESETQFDFLCNEVVRSLRLQIFDPRYLAEEGFVLSLYAF